jgi:hypothetical protein
LLTLTLLGAPALAAPPAAAPATPLPLRLDDAPELSLLAPFRDASGVTPKGRYLGGPFTRWVERSWQTLDWEASLSPQLLASPSPPISPRPTPARVDPCLGRLGQPALGWPYTVDGQLDSGGHFFVRGASLREGLPPPGGERLTSNLVPPWLQRVDPSWAHALLALLGCGRGGPCSPTTTFPAEAFAALWNALTPLSEPAPWWECRERPLRLARYGSEQDNFVVLGCDGRVPADALERLSLLARPLDVARPEALPPERDPRAGPGEWAPGVRLLHPRLLWLLHRVALKFPWRGVYLFSGYRPAPEPLDPSGHRSYHAYGRALDIAVQNVPSEELLALCNELPDVGCGYYPNNKFVHVDVRRRGGGKALWVDTAAPGEPSRYEDEWPGVVESGRVVWKKTTTVAAPP